MPLEEVRGELPVGDATVPTARITPKDPVATLVLAHGAGAGMDHPFMAGFARALGEARVETLRFDFPYIAAGRRAPDPERRLREAWLAAFEHGVSIAGGRAVLAGGKSLGGRIASMCVADGMGAAALVFLGYPLHPPGKRDRPRADHLDRVDVPMLFVQGTRDPFADIEVLGPVLERLGSRATHEPVGGGDHSFKVRGETGDASAIGSALAAIVAPFVRRVASRAR